MKSHRDRGPVSVSNFGYNLYTVRVVVWRLNKKDLEQSGGSLEKFIVLDK